MTYGCCYNSIFLLDEWDKDDSKPFTKSGSDDGCFFRADYNGVEVIHDVDHDDGIYDDGDEFEGLPPVTTITINRTKSILKAIEDAKEYSSPENPQLQIEPLTHSERRAMSEFLQDITGQSRVCNTRRGLCEVYPDPSDLTSMVEIYRDPLGRKKKKIHHMNMPPKNLTALQKLGLKSFQKFRKRRKHLDWV